ncbi:MAG: DUF255 domain-containing protein [Phycisphaerales bacterium]|nr:DUF255 domain-containing protein [Phycisphaerales bacterium]
MIKPVKRFGRGPAVWLAAALAAGASPDPHNPPPGTTPPPEGEVSMPAQDSAQPKHTNRLAQETSPYLLQHAHNPVDWWPWGPEAFAEARRRQVPILVSIGYSTCYWCHVMERESFENEDIARLMNERFVCIKVDREERPDVDDLYMTAVVAMTGQGGWPMNVFLTPPPPDDLPEGEQWTALAPFWGGTYFPPQDAMGRPGWSRVVESLSEAWKTQRADVIEQSRRLADAVREQLSLQSSAAPIGPGDVSAAVVTLLRIFDRTHGGFGQAPKFPQPVFLELLMASRDSVSGADTQQRVDEALSLTLDRMAMGGMYDQAGGGFHRYSTDAQWIVPHFEKMLYDNGQLAEVYAKAAESTGDAYYRRIADEICAYVLREMTDEKTGAFYSAQDAEVNHREGLNYLWTPDQVREALTKAGEGELVDLAIRAYGLDQPPNFRDPHHPEDEPMHILALMMHPEPLARAMNLSAEQVMERLDRIDAALLEVRTTREQPGTDDKTLAGWNGLMIAGLAEASRALDKPEYREAAARAWTFINTSMRDEGGTLLRSWRAGRAAIPAFCEDYALLAHGLLALHRCNPKAGYADAAANLMDEARQLFWDSNRGGWFDTREGSTDVFFRARSLHDGALPAATSIMLNNLIDLHEITGEQRWLDDAIAALTAISGDLHQNPTAMANSTRALLRLLEVDPQRVHHIGRDGVDPNRIVELAASVEEIDLTSEMSFEFAITLMARRGYHINAAEPGSDQVVPLSFELRDGAGLALAPAYPEGTEFGVGGETIRVYEQSVTVPMLIRRVGEVTGEPVLVVTFQACNDTSCLAPVTEEAPVKLKVR